MKPFRILFCLACAAALVAPGRAAETPAAPKAAGTPKISAAPSLPTRFKQVRDRIDALFHYRNQPPPPPDPRANPFRPPGPAVDPKAPPVTPDDLLPNGPLPESASSDLSRLLECVATLRPNGTVERDGQLYIVINAKLYRDNEVIAVQVQGETIYLRVRQISRRGVTLALNEAEVAVKF